MATPSYKDLPPTPAEISPMVEGNQLVFRNDNGFSFYVSDKDTPGLSTCEGECAMTWLPVYAKGEAKAIGYWTLVARKDGGKQWAYKGRPVYSYARDQEPGKSKGDGADGGVWHVLKP